MQDMGGLFQQAQKMQKDLEQVQEDLKQRVVVGEAGGGMVKVFANGQQEVLKVEVEPAAVDPDDMEVLEDLLLVAVKACLQKSKEMSQEEMNRVTGGIKLPGMM